MFRMNKEGFTLVELLVVLAILGLLAGIGIPQYMKTLERSRRAADAALVAVVQSAVDGFLAETGAKIEVLQKTGTGDKNLKLETPTTGTAKSLLTGDPLDLADFLEGRGYPTGFKSDDFKGTDVDDWYITDGGKVFVKNSAGTTIPSPKPGT